MTWASLCVIALLAGQVGGVKTEPTPAVRPAAGNPPANNPGAPAANTEPTAPAQLPKEEAPQTPLVGDSFRTREAENPKSAAGSLPDTLPNNVPDNNIPDSREIPPAADNRAPAGSALEPLSNPPVNNPAINNAPVNNPPATPKTPEHTKNPAQDIVAESLQLPAGGTVVGQAWPLAQALAVSADKKQQLLVIHSYWQLAEAVAKYHFAFEQSQQFEPLQGRPADEAALRAARSAAAATLREAELAVVSAQHDLAALAGLPADAPLPLPGDKPHTGGYRTNYQGLFAMRSPPPIARVIDRTLPIRFTAIKERAAAVQAAQDAFLAATESYQAGQIELAAVTSSAEQLLHERRALMETVCRYNHDIAEYAVSVLGTSVSVQQLVAALIEPNRGPLEPRSLEKPGEIQPTEYLQPMTPSGQLPSLQSQPAQAAPGQPTPALRPVKNQPTLAPVETRPTSSGNPSAFKAAADMNDIEPIPAFNRSANKPVIDPPATTGGSLPPENASKAIPQNDLLKNIDNPNPASNSSNPNPATTESNDPAKKIETQIPPNAAIDQPSAGVRQGLNEPALSRSPSLVENNPKQNLSTALYTALLDATPAVRAKELTLALHWDRSLPENSAKPMSLSQCLAREVGGNRREAVAVFWTARQRAAEYQAIAQQADQLETLSADVLDRRNNPAGSLEMLCLRAARLSVKAALDEAQAALVESQFELAIRTQSTADKIWPLPTTPPHSGSYDLNLAAEPRQVLQSRGMLRLTTSIPLLGVSVQEHAAAVIEADAARSAAVEGYLAGNKPLSSVLQTIALQSQQTSAFLQTLTDYNRTIADFALSVLPPTLSADKLAAALVVQP